MTYDYQSHCDIHMPKTERRKRLIGNIYSNEAQCLECKDIIRSKNRHDFVTCSCEGLSVDGGSWYIRRAFLKENYKEMSIMFTDVKEENERT